MPPYTSYQPTEGQFYPWAHPRVIQRSSDDKRTVVTINTEAKDRHGTIVDPEGGDLEAYRKNPVFLINHDYGMVAGNGANVRFQDGKWIAEVDDSNWDLDDDEIVKWHNKVQKGIVRMASIGFMPIKIERIDEEDEDGNTERKIIIREWELLEWSFVSIGSNAEALVQQRSASLGYKDKLEKLQKEINALKNGGLELTDEQIDRERAQGLTVLGRNARQRIPILPPMYLSMSSHGKTKRFTAPMRR